MFRLGGRIFRAAFGFVSVPQHGEGVRDHKEADYRTIKTAIQVA